MKKEKKQNVVMRIIGIVLIAVMLVSVLPQTEVKAASSDILYLHGKTYYGWNSLGGYTIRTEYSYSIGFEIAINKKNKSATVTVNRTPIDDSPYNEWANSISADKDILPYKNMVKNKLFTKEKITVNMTYDTRVVSDGKTTFTDYNLSGGKGEIAHVKGSNTGECKFIDCSSFKIEHDSRYPNTYSLYANCLDAGKSRKKDFHIYLSTGKADEEPEKEFEMKKDSYSFYNHITSFFSDSWAGDNKFRTSSGEKMLLNYLDEDCRLLLSKSFSSDSERAYCLGMMEAGFRGACKGMSISSGLLFTGFHKISDYGSANTAYGLSAPKSNDSLRNLIIYYYLLGNIGDYGTPLGFFESDHFKTGASVNKTVLSDLKKRLPQTPYIINCRFLYENESARSNHSILAYKIEKATGSYKTAGYDWKIHVYDPNYPEKANYIYLSSNGKKIEYEGAPYNEFEIKSSSKPVIEYADINFETAKKNSLKKNTALVITSGESTVTVGGKTAKISKTGKVTGKLTVDIENLTNETNGQFLVYISGVNEKDTIKVVSKESAASVAILRDNYYSVGNARSSVTLSVTGKGETKLVPGNSGSPASVAVVSDKNKTDHKGVEVSGTASSITLTPNSNGAKVTTKNGKNIQAVATMGKDFVADSDVKNLKNTDKGVSFSSGTKNGTADKNSDNGTKTDNSSKTDSDKKTDNGNTNDSKSDDAKKDSTADNKNDSDNTGTGNTDKKTGSSNKLVWPDYTDERIRDYIPTDWPAAKINKSIDTRGFVPGIYLREDGKSVLYLYYPIKTAYIPYELYTVSDSGKKDFVKPTKDEAIYKAEWRSEADMEPMFKLYPAKAVDKGLYLGIMQEENNQVSLFDDSGNLNLFAKISEYEMPFGKYKLIKKFE
ncbi:MAG: hypothetical protein MJ131_09820 [Lachnospiraceae bacterium]|nr:hypothetical protein [Lachnospiraceae bacterium]